MRQFNYKHNWQGSRRICHFTDLAILNNGFLTRICSPGQNISAVDLTMVTANLLLFCTWSVLEDSLNSDHFSIQTTIHSQITHHLRFSHRIDKNSTEWETFKRHLSTREDLISDKILDSSTELSEKVQLLTDSLIESTLLANKQNLLSDNVSHSYHKTIQEPPPAPW